MEPSGTARWQKESGTAGTDQRLGATVRPRGRSRRDEEYRLQASRYRHQPDGLAAEIHRKLPIHTGRTPKKQW
ncbi:MAG: hypothetical protein ACK55I_33245, partial [bacterium]